MKIMAIYGNKTSNNENSQNINNLYDVILKRCVINDYEAECLIDNPGAILAIAESTDNDKAELLFYTIAKIRELIKDADSTSESKKDLLTKIIKENIVNFTGTDPDKVKKAIDFEVVLNQEKYQNLKGFLEKNISGASTTLKDYILNKITSSTYKEHVISILDLLLNSKSAFNQQLINAEDDLSVGEFQGLVDKLFEDKNTPDNGDGIIKQICNLYAPNDYWEKDFNLALRNWIKKDGITKGNESYGRINKGIILD